MMAREKTRAERLEESVRDQHLEHVKDQLGPDKTAALEDTVSQVDKIMYQDDSDNAEEKDDDQVGQELQEPQAQEAQPRQSPQQEPEPTRPAWMDKVDPPPDLPVDDQGRPLWNTTVDFDELPEEIRDKWQKRFGTFYKSQKAFDRYLNQLGNDLPNMIEARAQELLEARQKESQAKESRRSEIQEALSDMDYEKAATLLTEDPAPPQQTDPGRDVDPRAIEVIERWEREIDDHGNWRRPWAQEGHPLRDFCLQQGQALLAHPDMRGATTDEVLATLDQVMVNYLNPPHREAADAVRRPKEPPEVLSSDSNLRSKKSTEKQTLTPGQMRTAERLFYHEKDKKVAHARYLAGLKKTQGKTV